MSDAYVPPEVWTWDPDQGGNFAEINRPVSGATHDTPLPVGKHPLSWLFWQVGATPFLGGGFGHFYAYAPEKLRYPIDRFAMETKRQLDVLDKRLADHEFLAGDTYSIADMDGRRYYQRTFKYPARGLGLLRDKFRTASQREELVAFLERTGCHSYLELSVDQNALASADARDPTRRAP